MTAGARERRKERAGPVMALVDTSVDSFSCPVEKSLDEEGVGTRS